MEIVLLRNFVPFPGGATTNVSASGIVGCSHTLQTPISSCWVADDSLRRPPSQGASGTTAAWGYLVMTATPRTKHAVIISLSLPDICSETTNLITSVVHDKIHDDLHVPRMTGISDSIPVCKVSVLWINTLVAIGQRHPSESRTELTLLCHIPCPPAD